MRRADLAHPTRSRLLAYLTENPGASMTDAARHLGLHRNAIAHHLRILSSHDKITIRRQGRRSLVFPAGIEDPQKQDLMGVLRQATCRDVLAAVASDPSVSWRALAQALGVTPHTVRWHVKRLEDMGLMHVERRLGGHHAQLHPAAADLLEQAGAFAFPAPPVTDWEHV